MKQKIKYIGFTKNNSGKIVDYITDIKYRTQSEVYTAGYHYVYLHKYQSLNSNKGWVFYDFIADKSFFRSLHNIILQPGEINLTINESKSIVHKTNKLDFGNSIFGTDGNFNEYLQQEYESNTEYENYLYDLIAQWYNGSLNISNKLYIEKDNIKKLSNSYPQIFKSPEDTLIFRYLGSQSQKLKNQITILSNNFSNKTKIYLYNNKIILGNIKYIPHRECSSWTINYNLAMSRMKWNYDFCIMTMTDKNCFMNPEVSKLFDMDYESEVIHFGKQFNKKIYLMFDMSANKIEKGICDFLYDHATQINNFKTLF